MTLFLSALLLLLQPLVLGDRCTGSEDASCCCTPPVEETGDSAPGCCQASAEPPAESTPVVTEGCDCRMHPAAPAPIPAVVTTTEATAPDSPGEWLARGARVSARCLVPAAAVAGPPAALARTGPLPDPVPMAGTGREGTAPRLLRTDGVSALLALFSVARI